MLALERSRTERFFTRALAFAREQRRGVHLRLLLVDVAGAALPSGALGRVRANLYRLAGFAGVHGRTCIHGPIDVRGSGDIFARLQVGEGSTLNFPIVLDLNADLHIGREVSVGNHVLLMTSGHDCSDPKRRSGDMRPAPIVIGDGAWVGARSVVLPGVTIGEGAVVAAGAVVTKDVPSHTIVAGVPARHLRHLAHDDEDDDERD